MRATNQLPATHGGRQLVATFAITQTIGYGCLYYSFAVLLHAIAADLRATPAAVTGALTTAILVQAAMAVPVGRWLDRRGVRALMTGGSALGAGMLVAWSQVDRVWQLYPVFAGLGVAMAMALYEPATAVLVARFDAARRPRAILGMIVVAGFASTIFMPLTGWLNDRHGWRATLLTLAILYAAVAIPLHWLVIRHPNHHAEPAPRRRAPVRDRGFWLLVIAFVAHAAAMSSMTVHLVGFLTSRGHPATFAATVAGLLGALSVTGRLLLTAVGGRIRLHRVVAAIFGLQAAAAFSLPLVAGSTGGAVAGVIAFGLGFGIASLATPQLLAERYGTTGYATIAGTLAAFVTLAKAGAPLAAAGLLATPSGYLTVLLAVGSACLVAVAGILTRG
ncbi:putative transporter, MFS family protein [Actinoplanes lobatus]|uniref:Putative MFS family arabinose efflux permease n=1 Tax=Actinoplanes lobatus TaxID=113568 RepID=A0A7W7HJV0_9ACTN|nr:MFS transporter [Actinoplanes lobatus]MBB4751872.1 putative MFS family arabinose efflux permease [Actinoplanes lobatus]GGN97431.1 putative transporter, MFS family protein [Actinoplanes lobatus]GIE45651.1 putative transporter, MFS family protein [Actinoplanes lobatus]